MLDKWRGTYCFDPANTGQLIADSFKQTFEMQDGYDEALAAHLAEENRDPEVAQLRLHINEDSICLANDFESERYPVRRCWNEGGRAFVEVMWGDHVEQFEIQEFEGGGSAILQSYE
jgi:hypothetical protein